MRDEQEPGGATGRVTYDLARPRVYASHHRLYQRSWGEILSCAAFGVAGVLLEQALIGIAFEVCRKARPLGLTNQVNDQQSKLGRISDLILGVPEDEAECTLSVSQHVEHRSVMAVHVLG